MIPILGETGVHHHFAVEELRVLVDVKLQRLGRRQAVGAREARRRVGRAARHVVDVDRRARRRVTGVARTRQRAGNAAGCLERDFRHRELEDVVVLKLVIAHKRIRGRLAHAVEVGDRSGGNGPEVRRAAKREARGEKAGLRIHCAAGVAEQVPLVVGVPTCPHPTREADRELIRHRGRKQHAVVVRARAIHRAQVVHIVTVRRLRRIQAGQQLDPGQRADGRIERQTGEIQALAPGENVLERQAGVGADPRRIRRHHGQTAGIALIIALLMVLRRHHQAVGAVAVDRAVEIQIGAVCVITPHLHIKAGEVLQLSHLRDDIDRSARRTAGGKDRVRAAHKLDALKDRGIQLHLARGRRKAVHVADAALITADRKAVANARAVVRDAGHQLQRVQRVGRTHVLNQFPRDDRNALRGLKDVRAQTATAGGVGHLIGPDAVRADLERAQLDRLVGFRRRSRRLSGENRAEERNRE